MTADPEPNEGIVVRRSLRALHAPEYQYLLELGREYRAGVAAPSR